MPQAPLSTEFLRQEYWSGLPAPPLGNLPDLGIRRTSLASEVDSLPLAPSGKSILSEIGDYTGHIHWSGGGAMGGPLGILLATGTYLCRSDELSLL